MSNVFDAAHVAEAVLSLDQNMFWDTDVVRELLFLLVDRWSEISDNNRDLLTERILTGPDQLAHWSDEEYPGIRDEFAARYGRYLELQGCALPENQSVRLSRVIATIQRWTDSWATSTVTEWVSHSRAYSETKLHTRMEIKRKKFPNIVHEQLTREAVGALT